MNKSTIIEAQNSNTVFEDGKQKGTLGVLKGIFADYRNGTRNSNRLYSEELWDNRVFGSEDVMEALETKTLFGELDHPEGDRCETLAQNAAITITKLEKRPEEGVIYGEAEILDTPTGRIVKALADSGAKLGISSRGMGEELYEDGQNIIDPETYDFITFDVVVTPANTKARVSLAESKHIDKLTESIRKEIKESETDNQLDQIKTVVESMNVSNKEELLNLIESKTIKEEVKNNKFMEANKKLVIEMLTKQLEETLQKNSYIEEQKEYYASSKKLFKTKYVEANNNIKELNTKLEETNKQLKNEKIKFVETVQALKNVNTRKLENLKKEQNEKLEESKNETSKILLNNKKLKQINIKLIKENKKFKDEKQALEKQQKEILEENKKLKAKELEINKKLIENKQIENNQLNNLKQQIKELKEKNIKLEETKERLSKVSFNRIGEVEPLNVKDFTNNMTIDERNLFNALTNK